MIQTDIVERLRGCTDKKYPGFQNLNTEAADTITQLRLSNERMREALKKLRRRDFPDDEEALWDEIQSALTAESGTEVEG